MSVRRHHYGERDFEDPPSYEEKPVSPGCEQGVVPGCLLLGGLLVIATTPRTYEVIENILKALSQLTGQPPTP